MTEQYELYPRDYFKNLKACVDNLNPHRIFIRQVGSKGGQTIIDEKINKRKKLDLREIKEGLEILIKNKRVFVYEQDKKWGREFGVAYERIDARGVMIMLPTGINPDDPKLPEPRESRIHGVNSDFYMQIFFPGKIPLKFYSFMFPRDKFWKYWQVDLSQLKKPQANFE